MCNQDIVVIEHQPRWKDNTHWKLHRTGVSPDSEPDVNAGRAENTSLSPSFCGGAFIVVI